MHRSEIDIDVIIITLKQRNLLCQSGLDSDDIYIYRRKILIVATSLKRDNME